MSDRAFDLAIKIGSGVIALIILGLIGGGIAFTVAEYHNRVWHTACHVNGKDRTSDGKDSSMRIYTDNCGVFDVQDARWIGHFNSADTFNSIRVGATYDFETLGFRIPFLSDFPNIIRVTPAR